jgi:hypothetical protein
MDKEYVCETTDCEDHWECRRIRWLVKHRGWRLERKIDPEIQMGRLAVVSANLSMHVGDE